MKKEINNTSNSWLKPIKILYQTKEDELRNEFINKIILAQLDQFKFCHKIFKLKKICSKKR